MNYRMGSLFDGSGGFPLASYLCGIIPTWASEVEPYPIAVTRERFPNMKHLGDISKINGAEVEPVDIITFGSPCQDLSVAGKRAGLKHEANGDEETTRSGLFMEAVRIIKEMRRATNGKYPRFALWENVPGAFSSNRGEDFRIVCEELIKIVEPSAVMPAVPSSGWPYADSYIGDGWSLAYRVFDAQYWGVPQRRRRIHLVVDFRGERAREVLFERQGVRGYFAESGKAWQRIAEDAQRSTGADDRAGAFRGSGSGGQIAACLYAAYGTKWNGNGGAYSGENFVIEPENNVLNEPIPYTLKIRSGCEGGGKGALIQEDKSATLATNNDQYLFQPVTLEPSIAKREGGHVYEGVSGTLRANAGDNQMAVAYSIENHPADSRVNIDDSGKVQTLTSRMGTGGGNVPMVMEPIGFDAYQHHGWRENSVCGTLTAGQNDSIRGDTPLICEPKPHAYCLQGSMIGRADKNGPQGDGVNEDVSFTCNTIDRHAVCYRQGGFADYVEGEVGTLKASGGDLGGGSENLITEHRVRYIVRRLTPTECARLQGFADAWGHIEEKTDFTEEEYRFWIEVRNTHAAINGREEKEYTKAQMLTWYNKLHTDSAEYKMWGNGIALPPALYCMQGIYDALSGETAETIEETETEAELPAPTVTEEEVTDLSEAPEEIKEEIMENAEKLTARDENPSKDNVVADLMPTAKASVFDPAEQLRKLAKERKTLASIHADAARFEDDVRALEYAISILEAVGL